MKATATATARATTSDDPRARPPDPKPPDIGKRSFAEVVRTAAESVDFRSRNEIRAISRLGAIELTARNYGRYEGEYSIPFSPEEIEAGGRSFQHTLIAKFTAGRPPIEEIRKTLQENWKIRGRATICDIWDSRHLLVILDSEEDAVAALTSQVRRIKQTYFRLFRFSDEYNPKSEVPVTTKWIRLPGLPPIFWHNSYIAAIANSFSHFLDTDMRTKTCASMRYARACVEVDVTRPLPTKVWIDLPNNKGFWQNIVFEGNMAFCSHCKIHGHELSVCRKRKPARMHESEQYVAEYGPDKLLAVTVPQVEKVPERKKKRRRKRNKLERREDVTVSGVDNQLEQSTGKAMMMLGEQPKVPRLSKIEKEVGPNWKYYVRDKECGGIPGKDTDEPGGVEKGYEGTGDDTDETSGDLDDLGDDIKVPSDDADESSDDNGEPEKVASDKILTIWAQTND